MERFNRRQLLLLVPGAVALAAACKSEPPLPEKVLTRKTVPAKSYRDYVGSRPPFDSQYLEKLLDELEKPRGRTINERVKAVEEGLVGISNGLTSQGLGVQLDESGYFLTVAHNIFLPLAIDATTSTLIQPVPAVWGLRAGLVHPIKAMGVSYENDLAVVYAPTGLPRRPIPNLQISRLNAEMRSKRWLITMEILGRNQPNQLVISSGFTRPKESPFTITGPFPSREVLRDAYLVDGIVSSPGLSGSPLVREDGVIESVLRGRLMQTNQGVTVAIPLSGLRTLEYTSL